MTFQNIATQIIKKSIRTAVCIDDEFSEPYEAPEAGIHSPDMPQKLYNSFQEQGECSLDVYRYKDLKKWNDRKETILSSKDLIILDWELDKTGIKYQNTLKILNDIIGNGSTQLVIIYTNTPELTDVEISIQTYFCPLNIFFSKVTKEYIVDILEEKEIVEDGTAFFDDLKKQFSKNEIYSRKLKLSDLLKKLLDTPSKLGSFFREMKLIFKGVSNEELLEILLFKAYHLDDFISEKERSILKVKFDRILLDIDGISVLIVKKPKNGELDNVVRPENLFKSFSHVLTSAPNNSMSLMSIEMKDLFRNNISFISNSIKSIDELAFFNQWNNLNKDKTSTPEEAENEFNHFLLENWLNELTQFTLNVSNKLDFFEALKKYYEENELELKVGVNVPQEELIKLGAHFSTLNINNGNRKCHKIQFGDIFWKNDTLTSCNEVLLCITPHCDARRPQKIKHTHYFIRGLVVSNKEEIDKALKESEKDNYSFLYCGGTPICIQWITKPVTIFIPEEKNDINDVIEIDLFGAKYQLNHITILKENYTQRVANYSFGHAMRVGITLPYLMD